MTDDSEATAPRLTLVPASEQEVGSSELSPDELRTLRQLERRTRTGHLEAVNIRDAQQLARLGYAHHGRGGWLPTREGLAYLEERPGGDSTAS